MANDVIQNSKKKGPEYSREFFHCLPKAFKFIGEECSDEKLFKSLLRILSIWEERGVYDKATISDFRAKLTQEKATEEDATDSIKIDKKRKNNDDENSNHRSSKKNKSSETSDGSKSNGTPVESSIILSPHVPLGDPPEPEELIEVLKKLMENSAASDVEVREQIANFPKEITDTTFIAKLEDKEQAKKFSEKVRLYIRFYFCLIKFVERGFHYFIVGLSQSLFYFFRLHTYMYSNEPFASS